MVSKPEQQRVFDWLNQTLDLPAFAELYRCAVCMLSKKSPGHITVVAHAGREIMNGLSNAVDNSVRKQVQYNHLVEGFRVEWNDERINKNVGDEPEIQNGRLIPNQTCEKIDKLIDEHEYGKNRKEDNRNRFFHLFLDYKQDDHKKIPKNLLKDWKSASDWFIKHVHLSTKPFSDDISREAISREAEQHFGMLDNLLQVAATSNHERLKNADKILAATNR